MSEEQPDASRALFNLIEALRPLSSEDRHRTVAAAMMFLGEAASSASRRAPIRGVGAVPEPVEDKVSDDDDQQTFIGNWIRNYRVSSEELDQVFHFYSNGTFDLLNVPGKSKREQTLNTYVLTGLGWYLASQGNRDFNDSMAREFCEQIGCYDQANHAAHLKSRGNEFTGDKIRGYTITNPGMKKCVALIKEAAGEGI